MHFGTRGEGIAKSHCPYVKVQWSNHSGREATWELEDAMREAYPHLFIQET